jgi:hypothetical protein
MSKKKLFLLLLIFFSVNAAGFILKYFELNNYVILGGFRFHLSFVLPFIFILGKSVHLIKSEILHPPFKNNLIPLLIIIITLVVSAVIIIFFAPRINEPEYFYEMGISSIIDFPVYLIWNAPQFLMLFIFLTFVSLTYNNVLITSASVFLLFIYKFISLPLQISYFPIAALLIVSISAAIYISFYRNYYWFTITYFFLFWIFFLVSGTNDSTVVQLLFASTYNKWEGFLNFPNYLTSYLLPGFLLLNLITLLFFSSKRFKH